MIQHPIVLRRLEVAAVEDVTPGIRRLTLAGEQLGAFRDAGFDLTPFVTRAADDHVKVFLPAGGGLTLPGQADGHLHWPDDPAPLARDYTVRRFDAAAGTLALDVVLHGHGPGARWGATAAVGDTVHVAGPRASIEHRVDAGHVVLIGDDTAVPAIARFVDELDHPDRAVVVVELSDENLDCPIGGPSVIRVARDGAPGTALLAALRSLPAAAFDDAYVWAGCEYATARRLRAWLRDDHGIGRDRTCVTHYWRIGDDGDVEARLAALTDLATPWAIRAAVTLDLPDLIDAGVTTVPTLAERAGVAPAAMATLLRFLAGRSLVEAEPDGSFELTALGEALRRDPRRPGVHEWLRVGGIGSRMAGAFAGTLVALQGGDGYAHVYGRPFWEDLDADRAIGAAFDTTLAHWAGAWSPAVAADAGWADHRHIVDVAGGSGVLARALTSAHADARVTIVELAGAADRAIAAVAGEPRIDVVAGSFFDPLPPGADAYVLAQVLHDWPDAEATKILARCAEAGGPNGEVVVVERLPDGDGTDHSDMSMLMLVLFGAGERTLDEYAALAAGAGLRVVTTTPASDGMWLIRCRRAAD